MQFYNQLTLCQRVQALPQELQDIIQDEVFTSRPGTIVIPSRYTDRLTNQDCQFPPPGLLRVSRATRRQILRSYYWETTFIVLNGDPEVVDRVFGHRLGEETSDFGLCKPEFWADECIHCPHVLCVDATKARYGRKGRKRQKRQKGKWNGFGLKFDVDVECYGSPSELCDQLESEEFDNIRRDVYLGFPTTKAKSGTGLALEIEDLHTDGYIHTLFEIEEREELLRTGREHLHPDYEDDELEGDDHLHGPSPPVPSPKALKTHVSISASRAKNTMSAKNLSAVKNGCCWTDFHSVARCEVTSPEITSKWR